MTLNTLQDIHKNLCHPGVSRLSHFVRTKNLPFSTTDVKRVTSQCKTCSEVKPTFYQPEQGTLIKATQPMERLSMDFKGPLPSSTRNKYLLIVVDEYSRFPFAFPCKDMTTSTVTQCLDQIFTLCGTAGFIHSDNGPCFVSQEFKTYLMRRGISSSKSSIYHPVGNGQAERTVQTVWKTIQLAIKKANLSLTQWEAVLADSLHSIRSLLCTATNVTSRERFFGFQRRSCTGTSLPSWMTSPGSKVYVKRFVRSCKSEPLVEEAEVIHVNPTYANVRYPNGREVTVLLRDLSPCPVTDNFVSVEDHDADDVPPPSQQKDVSPADINQSVSANQEDNQNTEASNLPEPVPHELRRSSRSNKGVPPLRYGVNF